MSYISRACSSLVRRLYYAPNCIISKIRGLETILATKKGRWDGRSFYMDEYTLIFLFSQCIRCAQKRDCWESVRFASERSRVRIPLGPPICRIVLYDAAFLCPKTFGRPCRAPNPEVGCEPGGVIHVLFENPLLSRLFLCILQSAAGKRIAFNGGAFMLHLSSWMTTLPMMLIGMTGILLVIGFFHRRRRRCFCRIHPRASCRVVWKYSLGVMPCSFLKARKKWL